MIVASYGEFRIAFERVHEIFRAHGMDLVGISDRQQKKVTKITTAVLDGHLVIARRNRRKQLNFTIVPHTQPP